MTPFQKRMQGLASIPQLPIDLQPIKPQTDFYNRPETEEDGIQAEALLRAKVRQQYQAQLAPTSDLSPSQSNTQPQMESNSDDKPNA